MQWGGRVVVCWKEAEGFERDVVGADVGEQGGDFGALDEGLDLLGVEESRFFFF